MNRFGKLAAAYKQRKTLRVLIENYLYFSENHDKSHWGSISDVDAQEVVRLVSMARALPGPIIEVGTLFGFSTQLIAGAKRPGQVLVTIDNYSWNPFCLSASDHRDFTRRALRFCLQDADVKLLRAPVMTTLQPTTNNLQQ